MQVTTIGLDLAKNVFHVHGVAQDWTVGFSRLCVAASYFHSSSVWNHA